MFEISVRKMMDDEGQSPSSENYVPSFFREPNKKPTIGLENIIFNREMGKKNVVQTFDADFANNQFCQKDIREHTGCINAVEISPSEQLLVTGGDDLHCRVWRIDDLMLRKNPKPIGKTVEPHTANIFSVEFDLEENNIYSGERAGVIMKHDIETGRRVYISERFHSSGDVYDLDHHPFDTHTLIATHDELVSFIDDRDRERETPFLHIDYEMSGFYSAEFHPASPVLLLINSKGGGVNIYDRRYGNEPVFDRDEFTGLPVNDTEWMGSAWSPSGNQFAALRKSAPPLYFDLITKRCFALKSPRNPIGYRNAHTIKSLTFIDDYTVVTGSDYWGIHIWKVPHADDSHGFIQTGEGTEVHPTGFHIPKEIRVLRGHRSIPNQVRFSKVNQVLFSSGVENSFKLWHHRRLPWSYDIPFERQRRGMYETSRDEEIEREKEERRLIETALDTEGKMEGRACWNDVFGGSVQTAEDRYTLEMFDVMIAHDIDSDEEDAGYRNEGFRQHAMRTNLRYMMNQGDDQMRRFIHRMRDNIDVHFMNYYHHLRNQRMNGLPIDSSSDSDEEDEGRVQVFRHRIGNIDDFLRVHGMQDDSDDEQEDEQDDEEEEGVEQPEAALERRRYVVRDEDEENDEGQEVDMDDVVDEEVEAEVMEDDEEYDGGDEEEEEVMDNNQQSEESE